MAMVRKPYNVLFLCTGNSARSIMAEALLRQWGKDKFNAFSAGSRPNGVVHPMTLAILEMMDLPVDGLRSKSWDEFVVEGAPQMDFIFTVCAKAAGETCPVWPGQPVTAHWGVADPAAQEGTERARIFAFRKALLELENRIKLFVSLPIESLDRMQIKKKLDLIGKTDVIIP